MFSVVELSQTGPKPASTAVLAHRERAGGESRRDVGCGGGEQDPILTYSSLLLIDRYSNHATVLNSSSGTGDCEMLKDFGGFHCCAYRIAVQKNQYCQEMYNGYKAARAECVHAMVLPHLMHKRDDYFLRELVRLWSNYCVMVKCITGFFSYLDRCFVEHKKLPSLEDTAATSFFSPVFSYFNHEITDALLILIQQERDGIKVDMDGLMGIMRGICHSEVSTLIKNAVLQDTYAYYSRKSSEWIVQYPLPDYLVKVQETMEKETKRLTHCLYS